MDTKGILEFKSVTLGQSLTLKCHYDCSYGFLRGCWSKASDNSDCLGDLSLDSCSVTLHLATVSTQDLKYNYTCYTQATDDPQLRTKTRHVVSLFVKGSKHYTVICIFDAKSRFHFLIFFFPAQTSAQTYTVAPTNSKW